MSPLPTHTTTYTPPLPSPPSHNWLGPAGEAAEEQVLERAVLGASCLDSCTNWQQCTQVDTRTRLSLREAYLSLVPLQYNIARRTITSQAYRRTLTVTAPTTKRPSTRRHLLTVTVSWI